MNIVIENDKYLLRPVTAQDKDEYMRVHQENSDYSPAYAIDGFRNYFWEKGILDENDLYMMVIRKDDDLHVANCSFQGITTETVEIGLDVDKSLQHQGIGTAVLLMLVGYLQEHMPDKNIVIRTKSTNLPCQKMVEKAGGIKTGEEATELETYFRKMIPKLEEKGYYEDAEESREALSRLEGLRVIVYEFRNGGTTDE